MFRTLTIVIASSALLAACSSGSRPAGDAGTDAVINESTAATTADFAEKASDSDARVESERAAMPADATPDAGVAGPAPTGSAATAARTRTRRPSAPPDPTAAVPVADARPHSVAPKTPAPRKAELATLGATTARGEERGRSADRTASLPPPPAEAPAMKAKRGTTRARTLDRESVGAAPDEARSGPAGGGSLTLGRDEKSGAPTGKVSGRAGELHDAGADTGAASEPDEAKESSVTEKKTDRADGEDDFDEGDKSEADDGAAVAQSRAERVRIAIDNVLTKLDRRPGETPGAMFFRYWGDNPFVETSQDKLSTFGVDVDTASYTLMRNYLVNRGVLPPVEAIRTEEFVNYFEGEYAPPAKDEGAFAIHTEVAPTPFAHEPEYRLLRVGVKALELSREQRKACALVFVVDTSGSMRQGGRLELVKDALRLLAKELDEGDTIGIVTFDRQTRIILEPAAASESERILSAINSLHPRSSTNLESGMRAGYEMAARTLLAGGANRVILLSDGVANTGITDQRTILANVDAHRRKGIFLTTVGVGMGNHNDHLLEQLANRGDGQCIYVDRIEAAHRAFVKNLTGTLQTVARDVNIPV